MNQIIAWFSCGACSAVASKLAVAKYPDCEVVNCDTTSDEHPDNVRFRDDVERWLGRPIIRIHSEQYANRFEVYDKTGWLIGAHDGVKCSPALKVVPRLDYARPDALHILGYTADEGKRIRLFEKRNPEIKCDWILRDAGITSQMCADQLQSAGIELPVMYRLGYEHNNCIGCVKGGMGYWNKIRVDFPEAFDRMAKQERKMGIQVNLGVWLDELDPKRGRNKKPVRVECGLFCLTGWNE